MLDKLFDSIGGDVISSITGETDLNADQAKQVLPLAKDSLEDGLKSQLSSGNMGGIMDMFKSTGGGLLKNALFANIQQTFMQKIMGKLGIPSAAANLVSNVGLSKIIGLIGNKAGDGSGGIDQSALMGMLGGGGGLGDMLGKASGMKDKLGGIGGMFGK